MTAAPATRRGRSLEHACLLVCDATVETMADDHVGDPAAEIPATKTVPTAPTAPTAQAPPVLPLHTPAEAARLLAVPESWLRRQVTARLVPHTRLGKHLRFSHADLVVIATTAAQPAGIPVAARRPRGRRPRATSGW